MYVRVVEDSTPIEGIPESAPVITKILIMNQWGEGKDGIMFDDSKPDYSPEEHLGPSWLYEYQDDQE
jgi:hypothetical protein